MDSSLEWTFADIRPPTAFNGGCLACGALKPLRLLSCHSDPSTLLGAKLSKRNIAARLNHTEIIGISCYVKVNSMPPGVKTRALYSEIMPLFSGALYPCVLHAENQSADVKYGLGRVSVFRMCRWRIRRLKSSASSPTEASRCDSRVGEWPPA